MNKVTLITNVPQKQNKLKTLQRQTFYSLVNLLVQNPAANAYWLFSQKELHMYYSAVARIRNRKKSIMDASLTESRLFFSLSDDNRLYSAILRSLEQTHCAFMWFCMSD